MVDKTGTLPLLSDAEKSSALLRVTRQIARADRVEGFPLAHSARWALFAVFDPNIHLNGWAVLRVRDIKRIKQVRKHQAFIRKALELRGEWPPGAPSTPIDLSSAQSVVNSAGAAVPLVTIHLEVTDPDSCYIGRFACATKSTIHLREITPDATWDAGTTGYPLSQITQVGFGGLYEQALHRVGGEPRGTG